MTPIDDLNRRLCEKWEPSVALKKPTENWSKTINGYREILRWSPLGFWHSDVTGKNPHKVEWQPRSLHLDPAMRCLVMEGLMFHPKYDVLIGEGEMDISLKTNPSSYHSVMDYTTDTFWETCVRVLAKCEGVE